MGDATHSPSSSFDDGDHSTDEDVWSPALRADIFSHSNAFSRDSRSPRPDTLPSYMHRPDPGTTQQSSFNISSSPGRNSNLFPPAHVPARSLSLARAPSLLTRDDQHDGGSNPVNLELDPSPISISPISWNSLSSDSEPDTRRMTNSDRRQERSRGMSAQQRNTSQQTLSGFVDLTEETDITPRMSMPSHSSQGGSRKRRRVESNAAASPLQTSQRRKIESQQAVLAAVEEVDLRDVDDDKGLSKVLEDQRMATIKAQQEQASKPIKLATLSCVICMDSMTDVTATSCGHLFCHKCLMEALIVGENQGPEPGKGSSKCPVCRKKIKRPVTSKKDAGQVIALEIKVGKKTEKGKGKDRTGSSRSR